MPDAQGGNGYAPEGGLGQGAGLGLQPGGLGALDSPLTWALMMFTQD